MPSTYKYGETTSWTKVHRARSLASLVRTGRLPEDENPLLGDTVKES